MSLTLDYNSELFENDLVNKDMQKKNKKTVKNHSRKYHVRKLNSKETNDNQNNPYYDTHIKSTHNEPNKRYRFKSYDYLPAKDSRYKIESQRRINRDYHEISETDDNEPTGHANRYHRYRRAQSYHCNSSNDDIDHTRNCDYDANCSSGSSYRPTRPSKYYSTQGDYYRNSYEELENSKHNNRLRACDNYSPVYESNRHSKFNTSKNVSNNFYKGKSTRIKNNSGDVGLRKNNFYNRSYSDNRQGQTVSYSNQNCGQMPRDYESKNMLTLRSTYRKNENVPHSGTKLENNRKNFDRFCTGTRNINNNDDNRKIHPTSYSKYCNKSRGNIPLSPKSSINRRNTSEFTNNHRFNRRPHRSYQDSNHSENESCYFENCQNANNEYNGEDMKDLRGISLMHERDPNQLSESSGSSSSIQLSPRPEKQDPSPLLVPTCGSNNLDTNTIGTNQSTSFQEPNKYFTNNHHNQHSHHRYHHHHHHHNGPLQKPASPKLEQNQTSCETPDRLFIPNGCTRNYLDNQLNKKYHNQKSNRSTKQHKSSLRSNTINNTSSTLNNNIPNTVNTNINNKCSHQF